MLYSQMMIVEVPIKISHLVILYNYLKNSQIIQQAQKLQ
jgi:hypothetical protein